MDYVNIGAFRHGARGTMLVYKHCSTRDVPRVVKSPNFETNDFDERECAENDTSFTVGILLQRRIIKSSISM